jgi:RimJ/RimL family protein N-acetyltransferase
MITEDSFVDFKCPYCGASVSFPREQARTVQPCPECSEAFIVPDDGSPAGWKVALPIQTSRLALRRFQPGDWKALLEFVGNEELFHYVEANPLDEDAVLRWLEADRHAVLGTPNHTFYLGIEHTEAGKLIGFAGLTFDAQANQAELRLFVNPQWQRQGVALEAAEALLGFCFDAIRLHRVHVACDSRNAAALGLVRKLGLRQEAEFVKDRLLKGEWANTVCFGALHEEWCARGNKAPGNGQRERLGGDAG